MILFVHAPTHHHSHLDCISLSALDRDMLEWDEKDLGSIVGSMG